MPLAVAIAIPVAIPVSVPMAIAMVVVIMAVAVTIVMTIAMVVVVIVVAIARVFRHRRQAAKQSVAFSARPGSEVERIRISSATSVPECKTPKSING